jgi:hypothetical protein
MEGTPMDLVKRNVADGAELANLALRVVEEWHGLMFGGRVGAHYVASEWRNSNEEKSAPADCAEASAFYNAAIAIVCRWYGITDEPGFRRYLSSFTTTKEGCADE